MVQNVDCLFALHIVYYKSIIDVRYAKYVARTYILYF